MSCITLRSICLIVGWIHILFAGAAIGLLIFLGIYTNIKFGNKHEYDETFEIGFLFFALYFMLNILRLCFASSLIRGVFQKSRKHIAAFICGKFALIFFFVTYTIVDPIWNLKSGTSLKYTILVFFVDGLHVAISTLFLWPVFLFYQQMDNTRPNQIEPDELGSYTPIAPPKFHHGDEI